MHGTLSTMLSRKVVLNGACEFGPIIAFMAAYSIWDFEAGTFAMIGAVVCALFVLWHTERHLPLFALLSTVSVIIFGGISLFVHIPSLFILRDTIFDSIFGIILLYSVYVGKPLLKLFFKNVFSITDRGWMRLTLRWGIFFLLLAVLNEWVRLHLSPDEWVRVKAYLIVATVLFGMYQFTLTRKERMPDATPWGLIR